MTGLKIINVGIIVLAAIVLSACSRQNLSKQQILSVADKVDEIRVHSISYSPADGSRTYRIMRRYKKRTADFAALLDALKNSADEGSFAQAIPNRTITLLDSDKELMKLVGHAEAGQFAWSKLGSGMKSRNNHIYLPADRKRLVE